MAINVENKRIRIKRSTVSGVVPTIPGSGATNVYDHTQGGWLNSDIYVGEMFANVADDKLWFRTESGIKLLNYSGSTTDFTDLGDTPSSYAGYNGYYLQVNSGATGLEFVTIIDTDAFANLADTPSGYTSYSGYSVTVNSAENGLEFTKIQNTLLDLNDVSSSAYTSQYEILMVNSGLTSMELVDGRNKYIDFETNQNNIDGEKYFIDKVTFDHPQINQELTFTGINETVTINNITTDGSFTATTNNEIPTSYAVKQYVDNTLIGGSGGTGVFVTTAGNNEHITGTKYFDADVEFSANLAANEIYLDNDLHILGNQYNDLATKFYFGDETTDGSYRFRVDVSGNLLIEKRESGVWNMKGSF